MIMISRPRRTSLISISPIPRICYPRIILFSPVTRNGRTMTLIRMVVFRVGFCPRISIVPAATSRCEMVSCRDTANSKSQTCCQKCLGNFPAHFIFPFQCVNGTNWLKSTNLNPMDRASSIFPRYFCRLLTNLYAPAHQHNRSCGFPSAVSPDGLRRPAFFRALRQVASSCALPRVRSPSSCGAAPRRRPPFRRADGR